MKNVRSRIHPQVYDTHQVHIILVIDTSESLLGCVADSLQERRLASISPTDHKDTKASIFCSEVVNSTVAHCCCGKEMWERSSRT